MDVKWEEACLYNYWLITLKLLKLGIPWEFIASLEESQLYMILGVEGALAQKEQEEQQSEMNSMHSNIGRGF